MNLLVALPPLALFAPQAPAPGAPPATLTLIVGVKDYAQTGPEVEVPSLRGPENDCKRARMVLEQRFGFTPDSIVTLNSMAATHEAIVHQFYEHLIRRAGPQTRVVFWFSGHGSRVPDATQRDTSPHAAFEPAFDSTLVTYDSRAVDPFGSYDISDDELHSLLRALRSENIVVVTDCCHSGGVLRQGRRPGVRECAAGTKPTDPAHLPFWPAEIPFADDDAVDVPPLLRHVVHISACGAEQEAGEKDTPSGAFGTLTWYLGQALLTCEPGATWDAVGARTRAWVSGDGDEPAQLVEVAGDTARAVFGGTAAPMPPGYVVDRFGVRGLTIGAGRLHGLVAGGELRLFDLAAKEVGTAKVTAVTASIAEAEWQSPGTPSDKPMRALPRTAAAITSPLTVRLGDGVDPNLLDGCAAAARATGPMSDCVLDRCDTGYRLVDGTSRVLRELPGERDGIHVGLFREQAFRRLWNGVAEPGMFALSVEVVAATADDSSASGIAAAPLRHRGGVATAAADPIDRTAKTGGRLVRVRVHNRSDDDLHIAVISVAENRAVNVVFGRDRNNVVLAHGHDEVVVWVGPPADWPGDRPFVDRYVAVATARFTDFLPFESEAPVGKQRGEAGETNADPWGTASCDLQIVSPALFQATARQPRKPQTGR